jgi:hypothetical protein
MADAADLKSAAARCEGSSPSAPTSFWFEHREWHHRFEFAGRGTRTDEVEFRKKRASGTFLGIRSSNL